MEDQAALEAAKCEVDRLGDWLQTADELPDHVDARFVLLAEVDCQRSERAGPIVAALDWCRRYGAAVVALLGEEPTCTTPWDLLLQTAMTVEQLPVEPAARRLILPSFDIEVTWERHRAANARSVASHVRPCRPIRG